MLALTPSAPGSRWWRRPRCCRRALAGWARSTSATTSTTCCRSSTSPTCCACSSSARSRRWCRACGSTPPATASRSSGPRRLPEHALVMHPGPMNRGRRDRPRGGRPAQRRSITRQVANGVAVRMAVLFWLLGSGVHLGGAPMVEARCLSVVLQGGDGGRRHRARAGPTCVVDDGRIVAVGRRPRPATATCSTAAAASWRPGLVDLHTHLRQPGREEAETVETGSRAAALGGYTAVVAMPNTEPAIDGAGGGARGAGAGPAAALCDVHVAGAITVGRAGRAAGADGRDGRPRRAPLHRRRQRRAGRPPDAPGPRVRRRASASPWPSTARTTRWPAAATCTRGSGRAASASPASRPRPRS